MNKTKCVEFVKDNSLGVWFKLSGNIICREVSFPSKAAIVEHYKKTSVQPIFAGWMN